MNTLHIDNLEFWGRHGITGDEKDVPQPFGVNVGVHYDFCSAIQQDKLSEAVDYKVVESIVKRKIEGVSRVLIERLADDIAETIFSETIAQSVEIHLAKLRAKSPGTPSVTLIKSRPQHASATIVDELGLTADKVKAFYAPETDGILHFKGILYNTLNQEKLKAWYKNKSKEFEQREEKYVQNGQEVSLVYNGPFGSVQGFESPQEHALHNLYYKIRNQINKYSDVPLKAGELLETKLMKYEPTNVGIAPHRDLSSNVNMVVMMNLYGTTTFYTASDKKRTNEKAYLIEPGDILVMRGPRTLAENKNRPIHYVLDIKEERLVLACREINTAQEAIINEGNWMAF